MNKDKNEKSKDLATARRKIKSIMKKEGIDEITIERQYLPELFSAELLEISKHDELPILKPFVEEYLLSKGLTFENLGKSIRLKKQRSNLLHIKDQQIETLKSSIKLKDEQIKTFENSLKTKNDIVEILEKTIELKEDEIRKLTSDSVDHNTLKEKDDEILQLQKELEILNDELAKTDEDLKPLELEYEKLRKDDSSKIKIKPAYQKYKAMRDVLDLYYTFKVLTPIERG